MVGEFDAGATESRVAKYKNAFAGAKLGIAIRELQKFQRRMKTVSDGNKGLNIQIIGKEAKPMSKKAEKNQQVDYLESYRNMVHHLQVLSKLAIRQFLGTRPDGDPRVEYLANLEAFKNLANVHLEVIMELTIKKLGISKQDFLKLQGEQLATQVKSMEQDLCITGWDNLGNPIFDLARYAERTALWPK